MVPAFQAYSVRAPIKLNTPITSVLVIRFHTNRAILFWRRLYYFMRTQ
jgi:hypothetical protein